MIVDQAPDPVVRVWIDAQLPPSLAAWFAREHGVAAQHVMDVGMLAASDSAIFEAARLAGVDAVVTKDEDFVRLVETNGPPPQIVWLTVGNARNAELRQIVIAAWPKVAEALAAGEPLVELGRRV